MGSKPQSHKIAQTHLSGCHEATKVDIFITIVKAVDRHGKYLGQEGIFETQIQHVGRGVKHIECHHHDSFSMQVATLFRPFIDDIPTGPTLIDTHKNENNKCSNREVFFTCNKSMTT
jgi:hypothetical protein